MLVALLSTVVGVCVGWGLTRILLVILEKYFRGLHLDTDAWRIFSRILMYSSFVLYGVAGFSLGFTFSGLNDLINLLLPFVIGLLTILGLSFTVTRLWEVHYRFVGFNNFLSELTDFLDRANQRDADEVFIICHSLPVGNLSIRESDEFREYYRALREVPVPVKFLSLMNERDDNNRIILNNIYDEGYTEWDNIPWSPEQVRSKLNFTPLLRFYLSYIPRFLNTKYSKLVEDTDMSEDMTEEERGEKIRETALLKVIKSYKQAIDISVENNVEHLSGGAFPQTFDNLPGWYAAFDSEEAIIASVFFLPLAYKENPTPVDDDTDVELVGFRTRQNDVIDILQEAFDYYRNLPIDTLNDGEIDSFDYRPQSNKIRLFARKILRRFI